MTEQQAIKHMIDLIECSNERILRSTRIAVFTEKGKYTARFLGESIRGHKCSRLYVSKDILLDDSYLDLFSHMVFHCLVPPGYHDRIAWYDPYDWRMHVFIY